MKANIDGLQALIKVVELGSFHAAAEALHLSQSALSRRISNLEDELAVKLLQRTTRRVRLTATGRDFSSTGAPAGCRSGNALNSLQRIGRHGRETVVLACIPTAASGILPPVLAEYSSVHPGRRVRILDVHISEIFQAVETGEADFGITLTRGNEPGLYLEHLLEDRFVAVCRRSDVLARHRSMKWSQLASRPLILAGRSGSNRALFNFDLPARIVKQNWIYEVHHSYPTGYALVDSGAGVAVVPELAFPPNHPSLVSRPLVEPVVTRAISITRRRDTPLSASAAELLALIRDHCSRRAKR
ncbi:MAG: LysR family transcriptional regulator [Burkholderiales bacterium]|nr:LysR family transcriptional regulator [Burkholderiales bacterium]